MFMYGILLNRETDPAGLLAYVDRWGLEDAIKANNLHIYNMGVAATVYAICLNNNKRR